MKIEIWPNDYNLKWFARIRLALPDYEIINSPGDIIYNCSVYSDRKKYTGNKPCINPDFTNDRKSFVDKTWADVCGYSITINPWIYKDKYVVKSDELNGAHDGVIMEGRQKKESVKVYQRLIDTKKDGYYEDIRVAVFDYESKFLFIKRKNYIFKTDRKNLVIEEMKDHFNETEINQINEFIKRVKLQYGELDILRDKDGRIYVIDITCTPGGGYVASMNTKKQFLERFKIEFEKMLKNENNT